MKTIGRKHFHFLFPAGMDGATGGVIPLSAVIATLRKVI